MTISNDVTSIINADLSLPALIGNARALVFLKSLELVRKEV